MRESNMHALKRSVDKRNMGEKQLITMETIVLNDEAVEICSRKSFGKRCKIKTKVIQKRNSEDSRTSKYSKLEGAISILKEIRDDVKMVKYSLAEKENEWNDKKKTLDKRLEKLERIIEKPPEYNVKHFDAEKRVFEPEFDSRCRSKSERYKSSTNNIKNNKLVEERERIKYEEYKSKRMRLRRIKKVESEKKQRSTFDTVKRFTLKIAKCVIIQIHFIFDIVVDFLFSWLYHTPKPVPPIKNELLLCSATELADKIRSKEVTSLEVVTAFIERAKEVNPIINAIVEDRYELALEEAKAADKIIENCSDIESLKKSKPFLGIPFTTKESNEAKGMLHTMGLLCRRDHRSDEDATSVRLLKEAGGILIAKTNIPELNLWCESRNNLYGQTCNPYNTTRTVGGSSGGEGAIIATCGSAISIGSDIGGSTRMPAFFCCVFGHKPTEGIVSLKGIGLRQEEYPNSMAQAGPICKKAEDLAPLLKVLACEKASLLKLDEPVDLKNLAIFYQESSGDLRTSKVNRTMKYTLLKAVQHFEEVTGSATKIKIPGSEYTTKLWRYWMTQENSDFKHDITNRKCRAKATEEFLKLVTGNCELTLAALMKLVDEDLLPKENSVWAENITAVMKQYVVEKLGDNGVLFYPSAPFPASYHRSYFFRPFNFTYWGLFNVLRLPCCQVPLGLDRNGLPVGVQVVAGPYKDHLCIAVARELERVFGGWVPPS